MHAFTLSITLCCLLAAAVLAQNEDCPSQFVYAMTNQPEGNTVVAYLMESTLKQIGEYPTNGTGPDAGPINPLGSQGAIVFNSDYTYLLVVNAGDDSISVFARDVYTGDLTLTQKISSTSSATTSFPVSVAANGDRVAVLNQGQASEGDNSTIVTFTADWEEGTLTPDEIIDLGETNRYSQVGFTPSGNQVVAVDRDGALTVVEVSSGEVTTSPVYPGRVPFAFFFAGNSNNIVIVLAVPGIVSYTIGDDGSITEGQLTDFSSPTACWIANDPSEDGVNFYTTNPGEPSVSGFQLDSPTSTSFSRIDGNIFVNGSFSSEDVVLFGPGAGPLDLSLSSDGKYVHILLGGRGTIASYEVQSDGTLLSKGEAALLLPGYNGLNGIAAGSGCFTATDGEDGYSGSSSASASSSTRLTPFF